MSWRFSAVFLLFVLVLAGCGQADRKMAPGSAKSEGGDAPPSNTQTDEAAPHDGTEPTPLGDGGSKDPDSNGNKVIGSGGNTSIVPHDAPRSPLSSFPKSADEPRSFSRVDRDPPAVAHSMAAPEAVELSPDVETQQEENTRVWKDGEQYKTMTVFYGTDRARTYDDLVGFGWQVAHYAIPAITVVIGLIVTLVLSRRSPKRVAVAAAVLAIGGAALFVKFVPLSMPMRLLVADKGIPKYGGQRGDLVMGICKVTIPRTHTKGNVERPDIRRFEVNEDVRKHIVIADVQPLADEPFYQQLRRAVERSPRRDLFLFIHGYNVTFESAALRTGQMAYDLEFEGAPVFYSWPSQGVYWKYTIDENNVTWAVPDLKRFLLDIAKHSGAKSINLIAHSMGNRALTQALRDIAQELKDDPLLFNQLILAAPDIDADTFKRDIAPVIQKTARRTTLYASSEDKALVASKKVHGYPRAGESGDNLLIVPGIHTIDVSDIESDVLGHSYYASSDLVLTDLKELFKDVGPTLRRWLQEVKRDGLTYWVYQKTRAVMVSKKDDAQDR